MFGSDSKMTLEIVAGVIHEEKIATAGHASASEAPSLTMYDDIVMLRRS
jgi:hypothetical protein